MGRYLIVGCLDPSGYGIWTRRSCKGRLVLKEGAGVTSRSRSSPCSSKSSRVVTKQDNYLSIAAPIRRMCTMMADVTSFLFSRATGLEKTCEPGLARVLQCNDLFLGD